MCLSIVPVCIELAEIPHGSITCCYIYYCTKSYEKVGTQRASTKEGVETTRVACFLVHEENPARLVNIDDYLLQIISLINGFVQM